MVGLRVRWCYCKWLVRSVRSSCRCSARWPTWRCTACIYVPAGEAVSRACGEVGHVDAACDTPHCQECGIMSEGGAGWVAGVGGWVGGWHVAWVGLDAVRSVQLRYVSGGAVAGFRYSPGGHQILQRLGTHCKVVKTCAGRGSGPAEKLGRCHTQAVTCRMLPSPFHYPCWPQFHCCLALLTAKQVGHETGRCADACTSCGWLHAGPCIYD